MITSSLIHLYRNRWRMHEIYTIEKVENVVSVSSNPIAICCVTNERKSGLIIFIFLLISNVS